MKDLLIFKMLRNIFHESVIISKKFILNTFTPLIRDQIGISVFTYTNRTHSRHHFALTTRNYSVQLNKSQEVTNYYKKKDKEELEQLLRNKRMMIAYKKLLLEVETIRELTGRVPFTMTATEWLILLNTKSKAQRRSYLDFRWRCDNADKVLEKSKLAKVEEKYEEKVFDPNVYGLFCNTMFIRISRQKQNDFYNSRLISAIMHEPKVVFDLDYHHVMCPSEAMNCAKQLLMSFALNRHHSQPFNLYFCNVNKSSLLMKQVHKGIPTIYDDSFPLNVTEKSYLDLFDKRKLAYLSPDGDHVLHRFDCDKVYIIGGMVDKVTKKRISVTKAKQDGIQMFRLPISEYLPWGTGSTKNLPLNQVLGILLDLHHTNNWKKAFYNHIPSRKLQPARLKQMNKQVEKTSELLERLLDDRRK